MKVLFIPEFRNNPYQKALTDSLSKEGIEVNLGGAFNPYYPFTILRLVKNHFKPDILHIHWLHPFLLANSMGKTILKSSSFIVELLLVRLLGINIVWTVHNISSHETDFRSFELFFTRLFTRLCGRIIAHSPSAKGEIINTYGVKSSLITVIPHGNYIDYYPNEMSKAKARNHLEIGMEDLVFLHFGRIRPYKGLRELVDTFKRLNHSQARLLIVGEPFNKDIANDLMNKCEGDRRVITIFSFIPDDEIQIYMNTADVVVLPYRDILTSGAAILAMSFGMPIIAPAIGCIPDILDSEGSFLYDPREEDGLINAMRKASAYELREMGKHNFELARKLGWDEIARKTHDAYKECLKV
ncbi:MAG: glycosyltransferase family 4 protein [Candidatus Dadabacteria bacterium]|nr:glycosyltransferase family 4 protein [Candidatus Dadabacteria bacterium]